MFACNSRTKRVSPFVGRNLAQNKRLCPLIPTLFFHLFGRICSHNYVKHLIYVQLGYPIRGKCTPTDARRVCWHLPPGKCVPVRRRGRLSRGECNYTRVEPYGGDLSHPPLRGPPVAVPNPSVYLLTHVDYTQLDQDGWVLRPLTWS